MRDKEYFDDKLFCYTNASLKESMIAQCTKEDKPMYLFVDEAIREKLEKTGVVVENAPRRPVLV